MKRRLLFGSLVAMAALPAACGASSDGGQAGAAGSTRGAVVVAAGSMPTPKIPRPNLVFLLLDDLDAVVTRPFLEEVMPYTMAVLAEGITFDNAFVPTSVCCPSRAALLSGRCGHNTNVLANGGSRGGWTQFRDEDATAGSVTNSETLPALLSSAGYETGLFGKYLNGYHGDEASGVLPPVPQGWSDWHAFADEGSSEIKAYTGYGYTVANAEKDGPVTLEPRGRAEQDYVTDVLRDKVLGFLQRRDRTRPFFTYIAPTAPHAPLPAAPRHEGQADAWRCETMPKAEARPNFFADGASFDDKPGWLRQTLDQRDTAGVRVFNCADWKRRLGSLYAVDEMVRDVVEQLRAAGDWDNTLLVVMSDNGYNLGAHALVHKMVPYEESIRVPLAVAGGAALALRHRARETRWAVSLDVTATLLDYGGVAPAREPLDGTSLRPLLASAAQPPASWRTAMPLEYVGGYTIGTDVPATLGDGSPGFALDVPSYRGVRASLALGGERRDWKYVQWFADENFTLLTDEEVYDLTADPWELDNLLVTDPPRAQLALPQLRSALYTLQSCKGEGCFR
jgi:arylsulfatase A-like enzyme